MSEERMTIPEVRAALLRLADELNSPYAYATLHFLVEQMWRRPATRKAPTQSAKATPQLYSEIREFALQFPTMTTQDIAHRYNVSSGRVSEAVAGKR